MTEQESKQLMVGDNVVFSGPTRGEIISRIGDSGWLIRWSDGQEGGVDDRDMGLIQVFRIFNKGYLSMTEPTEKH